MTSLPLLFALLTASTSQLGHEDFDTRERVSAAFLRCGGLAEPALRHARRAKDAEVRRRAQDILARLNARQLTRVERVENDVWAWMSGQGFYAWIQVDSLLDDHHDRQATMRRYKQMTQEHRPCTQTPPYNEEDREATRQMVLDLARRGKTSAEVIDLMKSMIPVEAEHCRRHGVGRRMRRTQRAPNGGRRQ